MNSLDHLREQAGKLMQACAAVNAIAHDRTIKPRRTRTPKGKLATIKGARH